MLTLQNKKTHRDSLNIDFGRSDANILNLSSLT